MRYIVTNIWHFYRDGFRAMTWGRVLWVIILLKLFVLFVVLKLFFFPDFVRQSAGRPAVCRRAGRGGVCQPGADRTYAVSLTKIA